MPRRPLPTPTPTQRDLFAPPAAPKAASIFGRRASDDRDDAPPPAFDSPDPVAVGRPAPTFPGRPDDGGDAPMPIDAPPPPEPLRPEPLRPDPPAPRAPSLFGRPRREDRDDAPPPPAERGAPSERPADDGAEEIKGKVKRLIFQAEDGFKIFLVHVKGHGDISVTTKSFIDLTEGTSVVGRGTWKMYKGKKGFHAPNLTQELPQDSTGVLAWLKTGAVPGVGLRSAQKLADKLKDRLYASIGDAEALRAAGLDAKKANAIAKEWTDSGAHPQLVAFLGSLGLGETAMTRVIQRFGMAARSIIDRNPWSLADTVDGIGFHTADMIALRNNKPKDSPDRILAALRYVLRESVSRDGHCGLPPAELVARAAKITALAPRLVNSHLDAFLASDGIVLDKASGLACTAAIHTAESSLAAMLAELAEGTGIAESAARRGIAEAEVALAITLDPSQRDAAILALTNGVAIITGGPGTGKSTTQKVILRVLLEAGKDVALAAPTGRAAKRLSEVSGQDASTCHRLLQFRGELGGFQFNAGNPFKENAFVVDEFSMVDVKLASSFVEAVSAGSMLTIVGDVDQLPSVGAGQVLRDLIESRCLPTARLNVVHRQGPDSGIVAAAHAINRGMHPFDGGETKLKGFRIEQMDDPEEMSTRIVELLEVVLPKHGFDPMKDIQVLSPQRRGDVGIEALNAAIKSKLNPYVADHPNSISIRKREYSVGDRVMHTRNDYTKGVYNGEVGSVVRCGTREGKSTKEPYIRVDYSGEEVSYSPADIDDVEHCYATTVHKSQGCEFPIVILALHSSQHFMLTRNLVYTGITRAKKFCVVIGEDDVILKAAERDNRDSRFTGLKQMLAREFEKRSDARTSLPSPMRGFIGIDE